MKPLVFQLYTVMAILGGHLPCLLQGLAPEILRGSHLSFFLPSLMASMMVDWPMQIMAMLHMMRYCQGLFSPPPAFSWHVTSHAAGISSFQPPPSPSSHLSKKSPAGDTQFSLCAEPPCTAPSTPSPTCPPQPIAGKRR